MGFWKPKASQLSRSVWLIELPRERGSDLRFGPLWPCELFVKKWLTVNFVTAPDDEQLNDNDNEDLDLDREVGNRIRGLRY